MLGISSYFQDLDYEYLKKASTYGAKYLFTSLHIPEEDYSKLSEEMPRFLKAVQEYGLELVPDISPATFEKLNVKSNDYLKLKELGFTTLRLDYGFDDYAVVNELLENFELVLNASVVDEAYIIGAMAAGVDMSRVKVLHNFYPKTDTGLSLDFFKKINDVFIRYNIHIMAFVPGDKLKRFPLYEGLPTIESHRSMNPYVAAVQLNHDYAVEDILIGDSFARDTTLQYIDAYVNTKVMHIPVSFEEPYHDMYDREYSVRRDMADSIVRILTPRIPDIPAQYNNTRYRGTITLDNFLAGRYSGEIQIMKTDSLMSARANVIGFVHPEYVGLIDFIDRYTKIKFVRI